MADKDEKELVVDVEEVYSKSEEFVNDNQNMIMTVVGAIVIIVSLIYAFNRYYLMPMEETASTEMFQAEQYFSTDSFNLALNGDGNALGMLDVIEDYGSTDAGNLATYYAGVSYLKLGQYEDAIEYLNDFSPSGLLGPTAKGALGDAYAGSGDMDKALSSYEAAADMDDNDFTTPIFLFKAGLAAEEVGDYDRAVRLYGKLKKDYADSREGRDAAKYLARSEAKL
ncbi:MAG: tetratricopeptide (TPR) repeat protein [Flavobacteriales bacterium]|jgi:tetratricopeptide (TPR) repeat protein